MGDERALPARADEQCRSQADECRQQPAEVLVEQRQIFSAKAIGTSRRSEVCTDAGSVFMQSKIAAAHVPIIVRHTRHGHERELADKGSRISAMAGDR